jgi:apolipoprotein N-acyltransferase
MLPDHVGVAICKDMDFQTTLRRDAAAHPTVMAVPAWDFDGDRWWHARLAIMRGVENGFAVARAAKNGLLTLSDAYGRVIRMQPSTESGMVTLVGDLPRGPGDTIYRRIGDVFAWGNVALALLLMARACVQREG